jgi:sporulation protein YlmC with PRC-barrel domain
MLHRGNKLKGAQVQGVDGDLGTVERVFFDDERWKVSHLVVHTAAPLDDRSVLVPPSAIQPPWTVATLPAALSREEVNGQPQVDPDQKPTDLNGDCDHVRSTDDLKGFHIQATDGEIGHVDDFLIDENNWGIRYLVVDTSNWIGGKWVAISPSVLCDIDWVNGKVEVGITRDAVKNSPRLDSLPVPSAETMPPFVLM